MRDAWIAKNKAVWPITLTCEVLGVSASGYFEHQRRRSASRPSQPGSGRLGNEALLAHIRAIHAEVKGEYGWPRVWKELLARGIRVGKDRVQRLMRLHGIKARGKRKFVLTTDSRHDLPVAENLLVRDFSPAAHDQVWSSDFTYIATDEGWRYLAAVIDLFSGQVVGWSMQAHMQTSLVTDALRTAWFRRHPAPGLIFHSDSGSQYCSHSFQLDSYGTRNSISRQAIEPLIGHTKAEHRMNRRWLAGALGDALHALSCAAGHNIRWLLRAIVCLGVAGLFCALNFAGLCLAIRLIWARLAAQNSHLLASTPCIGSAALAQGIHAVG